ncbi:carbohydrate kinase family protein [Planctomycetota bacterium]|nr:carbohydrate kinase family protein [Planctomycetota bacterium]
MMDHKPNTIAVAGHVCLDVIPQFDQNRALGDAPIFEPGSLLKVGPALQSTGGVVSNTGLALHKLGIPVTLMGKIGDDLFGHEIIKQFKDVAPHLADNMIVSKDQPTSYSVVIDPPGVDRMFLHCPGANDTFSPDDLDTDALKDIALFHFGYPPIMKTMYENHGNNLASLMQRVKQTNTITSLDMCSVDPESEAGKISWEALLANVLPHVDLFLPSYDEIAFMLGYEVPKNDKDICTKQLNEIASKLISLGSSVIILKLGKQGLYLRTTDNAQAIEKLNLDPSWVGREVYSPCHYVKPVGATGAGDCTIAGFLAAVTIGQDPQKAASTATAVGAFSVLSMDATGGIQHLDIVNERLGTEWPRHDLEMNFSNWHHTPEGELLGPNDITAKSLKQ